jgi:hypothetical protein
LATVLALGVLPAAGCGRQTLVLPVSIQQDARTTPAQAAPLRGYESAVRAVASVMVSEHGLPLPPRFTLFVYPTREAYAEGLAGAGLMPSLRAAEVAGHSVGLGQHQRLFINDGALRGACGRTWLGLLAHELTHLAQYELSGGRRGRSEQWLREGMAEWVAARVLERLGEDTFGRRRDRALRLVARGLRASGPPDLLELGEPHGWAAQVFRPDDRLAYPLAFLLADALIRQHGFESVIQYFRAFAQSDDRLGHFQRVLGRSIPEFVSDALARVRFEAEHAAPADEREPPTALESTGEARVIDQREPCPEATR